MKRIVVLGSTGSIGTQTLDVIRRCPENFTVAALAVRASVDKLEKQVEEFHPEAAVVYDEVSYRELAARWKHPADAASLRHGRTSGGGISQGRGYGGHSDGRDDRAAADCGSHSGRQGDRFGQ